MNRKHINRYHDIMLCKELGRSYQEVTSLPQDVYVDAITILSKIKAKQNQETKKRNNANKSKRGKR